MSERKRVRASSSPSSPVATGQDIQRRLLRPPAASSPPLISTFSSPPKDGKFEIRRTKELGDYLDLSLLSEVSSRISRVEKVRVSETKELTGFEWPINELKGLEVESEKEAVNLNNDLDLIEEFGDGRGVETCTPFQRFEQTALRRFKG